MCQCSNPSKRDRQFAFNGITDGGSTELQTANYLVWIMRETGTPVDYWSNTYVDFEIIRWGYYHGPPTAWYKGSGRREPVFPVIEQIHPEIIKKVLLNFRTSKFCKMFTLR